MSEILSKLYKYQRLWIKYVIELGCNIDTAKDIVQEFYLKMYGREEYFYTKDEPNYYGCYVILRNMVFDLKRKERNVKILDCDGIKGLNYEEINRFIVEEYTEPDSDQKIEAITKWLEVNSINFDKDFKYSKETLKKIYYRTIYDAIYEDGIPMTDLSRATGLTYPTIRNAVKIIKKQIKEYKEQ